MSEVSELRGLIEGLRRADSVNPYALRRVHAERAREVVGRLEALIAHGQVAGATPLLRGVIDLIMTAQTRMIDGSDRFGGLLDYAIKTYVRAVQPDDIVDPQRYLPRVETLRAAGGASAAAIEAFEDRPLPSTYQALRGQIQRSEAPEDWPPVRAWALSSLCARLHAEPDLAHGLIEVLLAENDIETAWSLATKYDVGEHDLLRLVSLREVTHPADVIEPYQWLIEMRINMPSDKDRYENAIKLIQRLGDAYARVGDRSGFMFYLDDLCKRYRRKRLFISRLQSEIAIR